MILTCKIEMEANTRESWEAELNCMQLVKRKLARDGEWKCTYVLC